MPRSDSTGMLLTVIRDYWQILAAIIAGLWFIWNLDQRLAQEAFWREFYHGKPEQQWSQPAAHAPIGKE